MLKISITCMLLSIIILSIDAKKDIHLTKDSKIVLEYPVVVKYGEDYLTLSRANDSLQIISSSTNFKQRTIQLNSAWKSAEPKTNGKFLGNGKLIVYGAKRTYRRSSDKERNICTHIISIIDCQSWIEKTSVIIDQVDLPSDVNPLFYGNLVTYQDTFDVFFSSSKQINCNPCRYNDNGERIEEIIKQGKDECTISFIEPVKKFDSSDGYFFSCILSNHTTVMKLMDSKFETVEEKYVEYRIHEVSIAKGSNGLHITICYEKPISVYPHELVNCEFLDTHLNTKHLILSNADGKRSIDDDVRIVTLEDGSAWIATLYYKKRNQIGQLFNLYSKICVQRVGIDGKISEPTEIKEIDSFLITFGKLYWDNELCLVVYDREGISDNSKDNVRLICTDPKKLLE